MKIRHELLKYVSPQTSDDMRRRIASAKGPAETLSPADLVTVLFVLSFDKNSEVAEAARASLEGLSEDRIAAALEERLDPLVIRKLITLKSDSDAVLIMAALNEGADDETMRVLAESGPEELIAALSEERELLSERPFILDAMKKNPLTSRFLIAELEALIRPGGGPEKKRERGPKAKGPQLPKDLVDEKKAVMEDQNIFQMVKNMSMGQKIKLALTGNKASREYLVKDANKIIAMSVLKNPRITEDEVTRVTSSKGTPEDVLRQVSRNKDWIKNYGIKMNMVTNPKTPLTISVKLLDHLYEKDLEKISRSKNIPSVLASTARRKLDTKGKG